MVDKRKKKIRRFRSLTTIIFTMFFATLISLMILENLFVYYSQLRIGSVALIEHGKTVSDRLASQLQIALWNMDMAQLTVILQTEAADPGGVEAIIVKDENKVKYLMTSTKELITIIDNNDVTEEKYRANAFSEEHRDLVIAKTKIGELEVFLSRKPLEIYITNQIWTSFSRSALLTAASLIFMLIFLQLTVLKPLKQLLDVMRRFGAGEMGARSSIAYKNEMGELAAAFNDMADTIMTHASTLERKIEERTQQLLENEKMAFLGSMVAGMAHEINTPVGIGVTASTHLDTSIADIRRKLGKNELKKSELDAFLAEAAETVSILEMNLTRAAQFVQSLKMIASDQSSEDYRYIKVKEYLDGIVFSLRPQLKKTPHTIIVECPDTLTVESYPGIISQAVTNLIMNSLTHGFAAQVPGKIKISATLIEKDGGQGKPGNFLDFSYTDNGKGIKPEVQPHLFEPFFTTLKGSGGTGLGLYILKQGITRLGGLIEYRHPADNGVIFHFTVPAGKASASQGEPAITGSSPSQGVT
jgi:signal transduction histidine kinase